MANTPLDVLQDYSQKFIDAIHSSLERNDRLASGLLWQSVSAPVKVMGQKIVMTIEFDSQTKYWRWVNDGRKAGGKQPPPQAMLKHIANRGISTAKIQNFYKNKKGLQIKRKKPISPQKARNTLAFLMGRSIKKKGIKPTNFLDEVLESDLVTEMESAISKSLGRMITLEIKKDLKNGNNNT